MRTVRREQKERACPAVPPSDPVDLLLDLERLQIVELGLVRLKLAIEAVLDVLARRDVHSFTLGSIPLLHSVLHLRRLKYDDAPTAVAGRKVIARAIELHSADQVLCSQRERRQSSAA